MSDPVYFLAFMITGIIYLIFRICTFDYFIFGICKIGQNYNSKFLLGIILAY